MGNCQTTAVAEAVLVHHPGGNKVERIYCSVTANEIMNSNPGHYVAHVVTAPAVEGREPAAAPVKQLKLLRPDESLVIGQVYRLISFEDVLKVFTVKKSVRLGRLLKETGAKETRKNRVTDQSSGTDTQPGSAISVKMEEERQELQHTDNIGGECNRRRPMQWRPALQSISELYAN